MKRTSFSAVLTALSFLVASGTAVTAQEFPSTDHGGFSSLAEEAGQLATSLLPPLPGHQDPGLAVAPAELDSAPQIQVSPQPTQAAPQMMSVAPQQIQTSPRQIQTSPRQIQTAPRQIQTAPRQTQTAPQQFYHQAPQQLQAAPQQINVSPAPQTYVAPSAPSSAAPIYVEQAHGEVFSSPANSSYAQPAQSYSNPAPAAPSASAFQSSVVGSTPFAATTQAVAMPQSVLQSPVMQQAYGITSSAPEEFFVDDSQIMHESVISSGTRGIRQRPKRGCRPLAARRAGGSVYSTIGVSALMFNRNVGNNRNFSTNGLGDILASNDSAENVLGGIDAFVTRRGAAGRGWEARYFGLYPSDESIQIGNNATHLMPGYGQLGTSFAGTGTNAYLTGPSTGELFNRADTHVLTRQTELNNVEFNFLKCSAPRFRALSTEFLLGVRYFQFGETLLHEAINVPNGDATFFGPDSIGYFSSVENNLIGMQIGARSDYQVSGRMMMHLGIKAGAFNNRVNTRQRVDYRLPDGSIINPYVVGGTLSGRAFDIEGEDDVKSILGEIDIAFSYQLSQKSRIRAGYRALGITDIAFASDQVKDDFTDAYRLTNPYTDETLVLQGSYVGLELAY